MKEGRPYSIGNSHLTKWVYANYESVDYQTIMAIADQVRAILLSLCDDNDAFYVPYKTCDKCNGYGNFNTVREEYKELFKRYGNRGEVA